MTPEHIFTYGSLMQGFEFYPYIERAGGVLVARATIPGRLYICEYPACVVDDGESVVYGEVYRFSDMALALPIIDEVELEGTMYTREVTRARLEDGSEVDTYIYRYGVSVRSCVYVESGDYRRFLAEQALTEGGARETT